MSVDPVTELPLELASPTRVVLVSPSAEAASRWSRAIEADGAARLVDRVDDLTAARGAVGIGHGDVIVVDGAAAGAALLPFIDEVLLVRPTPIVALIDVAEGELAVAALAAGALAAVPPPTGREPGTPDAEALRRVIQRAAEARPVRRPPVEIHTLPDLPFLRAASRVLAVVGGMGASAALESLLSRLPMSVPGMVAQVELHPAWVPALARRLNRCSVLDVDVARHGALVQPGTVWLAPGDRQVTVTRSTDGLPRLVVSERLSGHPSADALLSSVAGAVGREAVGVVLTGAGIDGSLGLLAMRQAGARTLAESRSSAVCEGMPGAAIAREAAEAVADLRQLPWRILESALVTDLVAP